MVSAIAQIIHEIGSPFESQIVELDELQPNEVLVDMKACGICHTDIAVQQGKISFPLPAILGHEGAGVISAVGSKVIDVQVGDHVILSYNYCTRCDSCKHSKPHHCSQAQVMNFGGSRLDGSSTILSESRQISTCFFGQSSFSNPTVAQEASCVKIDKSLPLKVVCALGCGFQTGAGSIYNVVKPLERKIRHVAIFGIGGVGCAAIMAANQLATSESNSSSAFDIIAVDVNGDRLSLAMELGATHIINSKVEKTQDIVMSLTNNNGLDAVVDCTGIPAVVDEMIDLLGPGGIAVTVGGPPPGTKASVDIFSMLIKCKTYRGYHQSNADSKTFIPWLAELYSEGLFPMEKVQKIYSIDNINQACEDMVQGRVIKPILVWDE
ncbi:hypothetical protein G7046_g9042 [Stylonectria norvegica]|nr:hypothetical protein G7046_g9042 [Stylonectria norvegica]